ncbi:HEAT repeat domain-containing protein [Pyxidicoccus trucidator]|uniref:HEAT repeat domain-containing protein n=1 Tax=Pyxidicoccus trucidator TaxID=2709662 RepID=UPI0019672235|nr:HEAT repeat domain-containing protein [Pyxidicoccus trucidator]
MSKREPLSQEQRETALKDILGPDREAMVGAAKLLSADASTTSRLLELLEPERRIETRHAILYALSWHDDLALWGLMVRILEDRSEAPKVRGQASEGLAYLFNKVSADSREFEIAVKALLDALKDPSPEVRYCALFALGSSNHPPLIPALKEMLADKTPVEGWVGTVADAASRAIEWIGWPRPKPVDPSDEDERK